MVYMLDQLNFEIDDVSSILIPVTSAANNPFSVLDEIPPLRFHYFFL